MICDNSEKVIVNDMHWGYFSQRCKELRKTPNLNCINQLNEDESNHIVLNKSPVCCHDLIVNSYCDMSG